MTLMATTTTTTTNTTPTPTTPGAVDRPQRPMMLSADNRKISYKNKHGKTFTLEFKNAQVTDTSVVKKMAPVATATTETSAQKPPSTAQQLATSQNLWYGVYDTVAMLIEESLEVACFGPYDEPIAT